MENGVKEKVFGTLRKKLEFSSLQAQNSRLSATTWTMLCHDMDHSIWTINELCVMAQLGGATA